MCSVSCVIPSAAECQSLSLFQTHYNLYPTLRDIEDRTVCKTLLQDQVTAWFKENIFNLDAKEQSALEADNDKSMKRKSLFCVPPPAPPASSPPPAKKEDVWAGMSRLQWLAFLLGVARSDLLSHLASLSSRSGRLEETIQICQWVYGEGLLVGGCWFRLSLLERFCQGSGENTLLRWIFCTAG